jgi:TPR repeat protein
MGKGFTSAQYLIDSRIADARRGRPEALFDLGVCYQTGTAGAGVDLIEAHKWFNLAAVAGLSEAADARAEVAEDMTAREIALAQRQARDWLGMTERLAA